MNKRTKKLNLARETVVVLAEVAPEKNAQVKGGALPVCSTVDTMTVGCRW